VKPVRPMPRHRPRLSAGARGPCRAGPGDESLREDAQTLEGEGDASRLTSYRGVLDASLGRRCCFCRADSRSHHAEHDVGNLRPRHARFWIASDCHDRRALGAGEAGVKVGQRHGRLALHGNRMATAGCGAIKKAFRIRLSLERAAGIEPATLAWKARALPLCNARGNWAGLDLNQRSAFARQIYSLVPLTTRPPTHEDSSIVADLGTIS
jgi:hypothetical protein